MPPFFLYFIESSICMAIFYSFYVLLLQNTRKFRLNRYFLLLGLLLAYGLPLLNIVITTTSTNRVFLDALPTFSNNLSSIEINSEQTIGTQIRSYSTILWSIYLTGLVLLGLRFLLQLASFYRLLKNSTLQKLPNGNYLLENKQTPTFSFLHIIVFNPQMLSATEKQYILEHEQAHSQQKHSLDILLVNVLSIVFWCNPLWYAYKSSLKEIHEFLADEAVLQQSAISIKQYAALMINQTAHINGFSLSNNFSKHQIKKRIIMMKHQNLSRFSTARYLLSIPLIALLVLTFSCQEQLGTNDLTKNDAFKDDLLIISNTKKGTNDFISVDTNKDGKIDGFDDVEQMPEYVGGMDALIQFIGSQVKYPKSAQKNGVNGTAIVSFAVNTDGSVSDVHLARGFDADCDAEAVRVVQSMPNWIPGKHEGKVVKVKYSLPIAFRLE